MTEEPEKILIPCFILCPNYTDGRSMLRADNKAIPTQYRESAYSSADFTATVDPETNTISNLCMHPGRYITFTPMSKMSVISVPLQQLIDLQTHLNEHPPGAARHFGTEAADRSGGHRSCDLIRDSRAKHSASPIIPDHVFKH